MTEVFEAHGQVYVFGHVTLFDALFGLVKPAVDNPPHRGLAIDLGELLFEGGQAASGEVGEVGKSEIAGKILFHKMAKVNFPWLGKVEQERLEIGPHL